MGFFCNTTIYSKIHAGLYFVCWSLINLFHTNLSLKHSYVQSSNLYYFCFVHFFLGFIITDLFSHIWGLDFLQEKFVIFTFCYEIMLVLQILYSTHNRYIPVFLMQSKMVRLKFYTVVFRKSNYCGCVFLCDLCRAVYVTGNTFNYFKFSFLKLKYFLFNQGERVPYLFNRQVRVIVFWI